MSFHLEDQDSLIAEQFAEVVKQVPEACAIHTKMLHGPALNSMNSPSILALAEHVLEKMTAVDEGTSTGGDMLSGKQPRVRPGGR